MHLRFALISLFVLLLSAALCPGQAMGGAVLMDSTGTQGTPFSADVVEETTRVLADGNRIHEERHGRICRDSQGRQRNEMEFFPQMAGTPTFQHVTIMDPTQHLLINLDPQRKIATVNHLRPAPSPQMTVTPQSATPEAHVQAQARRQVHEEQLGTMQIEGFEARGTRITMTTPAGAEGNEKPIVTVTESWGSPVLRTVLLTKRDDPRNGQSVHRLSNIQTGEPDLLLFQVPPDYQVKDNNPQP